jgi:putative ABC transport system permease protein
MLRTYFKVALRHLMRDRYIAVLNIFGLAIGMSTAILLLIFVRFEYSFDSFHQHPEQVFRITENAETTDGQILKLPSTLSWVSPQINQKFYPGAVSCRLYSTEMTDRYGFRDINHVRFYFVDSTFFNIFTFPFICGDPETALAESKSVVLTRHMAEKYFGTVQALDKPFEIHNKYYKVAGVLETLPANSHIQFDILLPFSSFPRKNMLPQMPMDFPTYLRINEPMQIESMKDTLVRMIDQIVNLHYHGHGIDIETALQSIKDVHLKSTGFDTALHRTGDKDTVLIMAFLAIFIVMITISNFVNLITAKSENRLREVGMRLIVGADKNRIWQQLIGESMVISILACFFALAFAELASGPFSHILGIDLNLSIIDLLKLFVFFLLVAVMASIITGIVHYIYLTRLTPVQVLSVIRVRHHVNWLKKIVVVVQFSMMIFLLALFSVLFLQVRFMKTSKPGFDLEKVVIFYEPFRRMTTDFSPVRKDLIHNIYIYDACASEGIPGVPTSVQNIILEGEEKSQSRLINEHRVNNDYINTYGIELLEGEDLDLEKDSFGFLLNETAANMLGYDSILGRNVIVDTYNFPVVGIINDFQYESLHDLVEPLVVSNYFSRYKYISVKMDPDSIYPATQYADSILKMHYPNHTFAHFRLADRFEMMYEDERNSAQLVSLGALLAIIISMLGLFGLSRQTVIKRSKEIGIRKANGGGSRDIMIMFIKDLIRWVVLSVVIALPAAIWLSYNWLDRFSNTFSFVWAYLVLSCVAGILLAIITILYHTYKVGRSNPVKSLRYE